MEPIYVDTDCELLMKLENERLPMYAAKNNSALLTRRAVEEVDVRRLQFQRDRDRIIHSRAFRRLMHKTQIFNTSKGDHFRNRLTHTLEVCQISRSIAKALNLNEELVEAIALGHDLGHTPFGHIGEHTLHKIISGRLEIDDDPNGMPNCGGFKHNYQGVHLIDNLEQNASNYKGMNLTLAVREGILKHTSRKIKIKVKNYENNRIDVISEEINYLGQVNLTDIDINKPSFTLEGQVVALADEIAQCTHDLEDGLRAKVITMSDLKRSTLINMLCEKNPKYKNVEFFYDKEVAFIRQTLINDMIGLFINKTVTNTMENINKLDLSSIYNESINACLFETVIVCLPDEIEKMRSELYKLISNLAVNSTEVSISDSKATYIIKQLFKAYYTNPQQLPSYILNKYFTANGRRVERCDFESLSFEFRKDPLFIRMIADHISSMTDQYALREYQKLHGPEFY